MKENQIHMDVNDLWNYFKNSTIDSIKKNIPTKSIGNKTTLSWVTPQIEKLISKKNKLFKKKTSNSDHTKIYKEVKSKLQKEMRNSYWNCIENMIFDLDINEPDQQKFNKQPKNLYSYIMYIKSQKTELTSIAPLRNEGVLLFNNNGLRKSV
jgi:1,2-phenylacetyl-CoA epoxidase catalytic subunit